MWNKSYNELKECVAKHGNAFVPQTYSKNGSLGFWADKQRKIFKALQLGHDSSEAILTKKRVQKLNEIGFVWDAREAHWFERLQELKAYRKNHGNTLVSQSYPANPSLGVWVSTQRSDYAHYQKKMAFEEKWRGVEVLDDEVKDERERLTRRKGGMTERRIRLLEAEDFVWDALEAIWFERLQELKAYRKKHGNTLVPNVYPDNLALGAWVKHQRRDYSLYMKKMAFEEKWRGVEVLDDEVEDERERLRDGLRGMTKERIQLLEAEDFVWDAQEAMWFKRLQELKAYRKNHGSTLVPKVYPANPSFGLWVRRQRSDYAHYQKKKAIEEKWSGKKVLDDEVKEEMESLTKLSTGMTEKRIQLLEAEDFVWDALAYAWELQFQKLCTFVELNGHAVIQQRRGGTYDPLAEWASSQRKHYKKHQNGQHTPLTEERIKRLNSIGFAWDVRCKPKLQRQHQAK